MAEAPNEKEARIRGKDKLKILKSSVEVLKGARVDDCNFLPGLDVSQQDLENGGRLTQIREDDIRKLIDKIVRGTTYLEYQLFVEKDQEIMWQNSRLPEFACPVNAKRRVMPGLQIDFDCDASLGRPILFFVISIWERVQFHAAVTPGESQLWDDTVSGAKQVEALWML